MSQGNIIVAAESTYDTAPASGWRELPFTADNLKTRRDQLRPGGFRAGTGAPAAAGSRIVTKGAEGDMPIEGMSNGLGILNATVFDSVTSGVVSGGTLAYEQIAEWGASGAPANKSVAVEVRRPRDNGTIDAYTYTGGRATQLEIGQDSEGFLQFTYGMDFQTALRQASLPSRTIAEVLPDITFAWSDANISLAPLESSVAAKCVDNFTLTLPTGIKTDKYCIKRGSPRHTPMRVGTPAPTGQLQWDYSDPAFYDAFVAGDIWVLTADWLGAVAIEDDTFPSLTIAVAAIQFSGEDPEMQIDDATRQNIPFDIVSLDDGNPEVTMTFVTSDSAL